MLAGGLGWQSTEAERIAPLVEQALALRLPVGAICNATLFLAAHGFLNKVRHTGNTAEMMEQWGGGRYTGRPLYEERQAVSDRGIVTANGTGYAEFAREMLRLLDADTEEASQPSTPSRRTVITPPDGSAGAIHTRTHGARRGAPAGARPRDPSAHGGPRMISGHIQGRLLRMLTAMIRPRRVLEIGTFTGYSALSMAAGTEEGATIDTFEVDDEQRDFIQSWFDRSPHGKKIRLHIGSALELAPGWAARSIWSSSTATNGNIRPTTAC